jgi:hypothetical protein
MSRPLLQVSIIIYSGNKTLNVTKTILIPVALLGIVREDGLAKVLTAFKLKSKASIYLADRPITPE